MRLTLLSIAFFTTCLATAAAQPGPSALTTANTSKIVKAKQVAKAPETARMRLQPGQEAIKVSTAHSAVPGRTLPQGTVAVQPDEPADLPYGTLLATLVLMAAIAVRRSKAGRP
jgi:hypothetical protein